MTELKYYEIACQDLKDMFVKRFFGKTDPEVWWVADKIGEVLFVNDFFFDMVDITQFIRYRYTRKEMFEYYDQRLEALMAGSDFNYNIYSWKKLKK